MLFQQELTISVILLVQRLDIYGAGEHWKSGFIYSHGIATNIASLVTIDSGFYAPIPVAINNKGQILGVGTSEFDRGSGFFLSPVAPIPEPSTYAMLLAGLGLVGFVGRKRVEK